MEYNAYDELMSYFQFELNVYILLVVIILAGVIKGIVTYRESSDLRKVGNLPKNKRLYEFAVSLLAVLGLANAMFFQGVISDIPLESGIVWIDKSTFLFIAAIVLFIIQLVLMVITDMRIRKRFNQL